MLHHALEHVLDVLIHRCSHMQLLNRIVQLGLNHQPEWRLFEYGP